MSPAGTSAAAVAGSSVRSRCTSSRAVSTRASTGDAAPSLLPWLSRVTDDAGLESRVALADGPYGRSLVALRQLASDEVIFNIPFSLVFAEEDEWDARNEATDTGEATERLPWSAEMAMRLLEARAGVDRPELRPWIDSLPSFVSTPPLEYSAKALDACQDAFAIGEAKEVHAAHAAAAEAPARASRRRRMRRRRSALGRRRAATAGASRTAREARTSPFPAWTCATTASRTPPRRCGS